MKTFYLATTVVAFFLMPQLSKGQIVQQGSDLSLEASGDQSEWVVGITHDDITGDENTYQDINGSGNVVSQNGKQGNSAEEASKLNARIEQQKRFVFLTRLLRFFSL